MRLPILAALLLLLATTTACLYRMPTDDDIVAKPVTNNPLMTRDKGNGLMPGASF